MDPMKVPLEDLIEKRHSDWSQWAIVRELRAGVGFSHRGVDRRIDVAVFGCWPSKGLHRIAYEMKRSRGDFMREIDNPMKRKWVEENFHQTYFVTSHGVCKPEEIPESWGLYVATKDGKKLRRVKAAQHRDVGEMTEMVALSAMRSLAARNQDREHRHYYFEGMWIQQHQLDEMVQGLVDDLLEPQQQVMQKKLEDAVAEQEKYRQKQHDLMAPLFLLAKEIGHHHRFGGFVRRDQSPPTVEEVRKWIESVRARAIKGLLQQLKGCATGIDIVLQKAREEGLDGA